MKAMFATWADMASLQKKRNRRVKAVGQTARGRVLVAVFTFRNEAIRPITAYDATIRDQGLYLKGHDE